MGKIPNNSSSMNGTNNLPPSYSESVRQGCSITNLPKDQMAALVSNIANATIASAALPQNLSTVERNLQGLQNRFGKSNWRIFILTDKEIKLRIQMPDKSACLPIDMFKTEDSINLSLNLPPMLQTQKVTTILDLLKKEFPKLTASSFFNEETQISKFIFSSAIPVNNENKGNFFPQIEAEGEIAYIAWDSSGSRVARGFTKKTCDVLFENKETFSGVALSTENLEGIENGAGVSAHFMTSKVTIIGILIVKSSKYDWQQNRVETDSFDNASFSSRHFDSRLVCDGPSHTPFGMLGCQGVKVSTAQEDLSDREKRAGEKLIPFCLEIVPQFSSEGFPVQKDDLVMAIDMQLQDKAFEQIERMKRRF